MKIEETDSECTIFLESSDSGIDCDNLDRFALKFLSKNIKKLIIRFEYGYKQARLNLSLLFNSILQNPHIEHLSIQGYYNLNYSVLKCLKDKDIKLEFCHGIIASIKEITRCVREFKSITHIELGTLKTDATEEQFIELLQLLLTHHQQLCSLILPLPNNYSNNLISMLSSLVNIRNITKFGFCSPCKTNDVLTILTYNKTIKNLGFAKITDLTEDKIQELFSIIKTNLSLTHFTLHTWNKECSSSLIEGLSQLSYLDSLLLDCGNNIEFITESIPDLIDANLNIKSIELLHLDTEFTNDLTREYVVHSSLDLIRFSGQHPLVDRTVVQKLSD